MELDRTDGRLKRRQRPKIGHANVAKEGRFESVITPSANTLARCICSHCYLTKMITHQNYKKSKSISPLTSIGILI